MRDIAGGSNVSKNIKIHKRSKKKKKLLTVSKSAMLYSCSWELPDGSCWYGEVDNLHWIDHHKTAIKKHPEMADLKGIRNIDKSGCELAWEYFNKHGKHGMIENLKGEVVDIDVRTLSEERLKKIKIHKE